MNSLYDSIYQLVRMVPRGTVTTYGTIAQLSGRCGARTVGYALSALKEGTSVPWFRVVNRKGEMSMADPEARMIQRGILEAEGIEFDESERIDLQRFGWNGP